MADDFVANASAIILASQLANVRDIGAVTPDRFKKLAEFSIAAATALDTALHSAPVEEVAVEEDHLQ